jgi:hypothetical protein
MAKRRRGDLVVVDAKEKNIKTYGTSSGELLEDSRTRWVFATPKTGPFAESELTDAHPAFIRQGCLHSVRIRPDGRTELIVGEAPPTVS